MIGRLMTMTAHAGRGGELAAVLLRVAERLHGFPGCEIYLISQDTADPDTVHVTEVWRDDASAQAALATPSPANVPPPQTSLRCCRPRRTARTSPSWAGWVSRSTTSPDEQAPPPVSTAPTRGPRLRAARSHAVSTAGRGARPSATLGPGRWMRRGRGGCPCRGSPHRRAGRGIRTAGSGHAGRRG
ncbi:putative quinol monooxygenase [Streptomyces sp. NPDC058961]|uniref:putative quinol monooxygenase n=1 Tax=Streptomyces sp. NPDC058961 TaxID=3346680 RepID=UPI00368045A1